MFWNLGKAFIGLAITALVGSVLPGFSPRSEVPVQLGQPLLHLSGQQALRSAYHLDVVAMPEPPDLPPPVARSDSSTTPVTCPVELRGIVAGDDSSFAILAFDDKSELVRSGQGVKTTRGWVAITSLASNHVQIRFGGRSLRCTITD